MKTIAIIASCDTKMREVEYMRNILIGQQMKVMVIDMSIGLGDTIPADITRENVLKDYGVLWKDVRRQSKGELMVLMGKAIVHEVIRLYAQNRFDGIISAGGVQNTTIATKAMQELPIGFPKVMVTTIASGGKTFAEVTGNTDIIAIPAIADLCGINMITRSILKNACLCVVGMAKYGGQMEKRKGTPVVGVTLMGITNDGGCAAIDKLNQNGVEAIGFHATGAGGEAMEKLVQKGMLDGILDMTTHEIVSEYFGGGFSYGSHRRMLDLADRVIPTVVSVGGLDFIDYDIKKFPFPLVGRKYNKHNERLAHIKLLPAEAEAVAELFVNRINKASEITLILPTDGMRKNTRRGEELFDEGVDELIYEKIRRKAGKNVSVISIEGNLDTREWGEKIAETMLEKLRKKGFLQ